MKKFLLIIFFLFTLWLVWQLWTQYDKNTNYNNKIELTKEEKIQKQFSIIDWSHILLKNVVKSKMKDPDSFEHIDTNYIKKENKIIVIMKYKAKNSFWAYVSNIIIASFDFDWKPIEIIKWL